MKIAVFGTGGVGRTLSNSLDSLGHKVMMGTRDVAATANRQDKDMYGGPSFAEWHASNGGIQLGTFADAAIYGDIIFNATSGDAALKVLEMAGSGTNGKVLVDITNPLDFSQGMPPTMIPSLINTNSLGEEIQRTFPLIKVVKALNTMWNGLMVNPSMLSGGDHHVFICGNDSEAKEEVKERLHEFGWKDDRILDLGDITASRGMEMILPLWLRIMMTYGNGAFNFKIEKMQ
jgi:predicted dinucleotide-binding enzyme